MINTERLFDELFDAGFDPEFMEDETELVVRCPSCGDDRPRLYIAAESGLWICFHCHEKGSLFTFFRDGLNLDADEAFERIRRLTLPEERGPTFAEPEPDVDSPVELPDAFQAFDYSHENEVYAKYVRKRGVPLSLAISRGLGYTMRGYFAFRVVVPVETAGRLYTFVARTVFRSCPDCALPLDNCQCTRKISKVLTPKGGQPSKTLYNLDYVRLANTVVVVEGVFDALRLPDEAVALLGSDISPTQVALLQDLHRHGKEIILCLDNDKAGRAGTKKAADALLSAMVPVRVAELPAGADPGSLSSEALADCLQAAKEYALM